MRTLKKSLALVLALVMVLGLAVVGASADNAIDKFEDSDQIGDAYLEAVGVLTGLAIVDGMTDTEIAPQGTYQRDQAAKIIAYMVLGKEAADSLVASYAPFQDVPADYWAAGYIAFCKEQGIIDGVSETSFDPYGTLTGFQWAKMLLAAVGFNANNELEGDSWSLNTARTGHEVGLFDGDNAGADHVALRREQAMLYAFNTLTNVRQVSYTGNGNNYVYDIFGYEWADGTGYTLGYDVFDLKSVEGQIIDNEGMGNSKTVVANANYTEPSRWELWWDISDPTTVSVNADTGLDLMYHAVRVWYTGSNTNGTNVYVNDLATVTTYECDHAGTELSDAIDDIEDDGNDVSAETVIGEVGIDYESYLIDNTALDLSGIASTVKGAVEEDYAYVTLKADYGTKGYTGRTETTLDGFDSAAVTAQNDDILTDISEIAFNDEVIFVKADSTQTDGVAWYVYPVTTTEGVVDEITREKGVTTLVLTDGTELECSVFWPLVSQAEDAYVLGQNYVFALDTHGDVIYATRDNARDLYYYTGEWRYNTDHSAISSDWVREYRFYNVTTGDQAWFPMSSAPGAADSYYDVRATAGSNGMYKATQVTRGNNPYAAEYVIGDFNFDVDSDRATATNVGTVYFDVDELTFLVAVGSGEDMTVETYTGIDQLAEEYPVAATSYFDLDNACFTVSRTLTNGKYATVVFVDADELSSYSSYIFIPENVTYGEWDTVTRNDDDLYVVSYDNAYVDGVRRTVYLYLTANEYESTDFALERGFYFFSYNVDGDGRYVIEDETRVDDGQYCAYNDVHFEAIDPDGTHWEFWTGYDYGSNRIQAYNDEVKVVDLTDSYVGETETLQWLFTYMYDALQGNDVRLAYTVNQSTGRVTAVYVMDNEWHNSLTVSLGANMDSSYWTLDSQRVWNDLNNTTDDVTVSLVPGADRTDATVAFDWTLTVNGNVTRTGRNIVTYNDGSFDFTINDVDIDWDTNATLTIDAVYFTTDDINVSCNVSRYVQIDIPEIYVFDGSELTIGFTPYETSAAWDGNETATTSTVNGTAVTATVTGNTANTRDEMQVVFPMTGIEGSDSATIEIVYNW